MATLIASEAEIKRACEDYLQYQQNLGNLVWFRLNSGMIVANSKGKSYVVKGCQKGTSDLLVVRKGVVGACPVHTHTGVEVAMPIFIEVKRVGAKLSEAQWEFGHKVADVGADYRVVHSLDELMEILE